MNHGSKLENRFTRIMQISYTITEHMHYIQVHGKYMYTCRDEAINFGNNRDLLTLPK